MTRPTWNEAIEAFESILEDVPPGQHGDDIACVRSYIERLERIAEWLASELRNRSGGGAPNCEWSTEWWIETAQKAVKP